MTIAEKNEFIKKNKDDLTINEIIATDLQMPDVAFSAQRSYIEVGEL